MFRSWRAWAGGWPLLAAGNRLQPVIVAAATTARRRRRATPPLPLPPRWLCRASAGRPAAFVSADGTPVTGAFPVRCPVWGFVGAVTAGDPLRQRRCVPRR